MNKPQSRRYLILVAILIASIFAPPATAVDAPTPTFSTNTSRQDGFSFRISNFSTLYTYTATTDKGFVDVGYHNASSPSTSYLVVIAFGLNKGESANVTVSASRSGYTTTSASITGTTVAAPSLSSCAPITSVSGGYTTLEFRATSDTVDRICDWTVPDRVTSLSEIAVVGGGGGGGFYGNAGRGGAGAVLYTTNYSLTPGASIRMIIGAGGAKAFQGSGYGPGHNGNNTIFNGIVAAGGGGGGGGDSSTGPRFCNGFRGGSGGGGNDNNCGSVGGDTVAASVCACSGSWTIYANAGEGTTRRGGSAGSNMAGVTLIGTTLGATSTNVTTGTGNGGGVDIAGSSGVIRLKYLTPPVIATISLAAISSSVSKGISHQLVATVSHPGKVRFFADNKRIVRCLAVASTGTSPITATCNWKPSVTKAQKVKAIFTPTDTSIAPVSIEVSSVAIKRNNKRA